MKVNTVIVAVIVCMIAVLSACMHKVQAADLEPKSGCTYHSSNCRIGQLEAFEKLFAGVLANFKNAEFTQQGMIQAQLNVTNTMLKLLPVGGGEKVDPGCFAMLGNAFFEPTNRSTTSFIREMEPVEFTKESKSCMFMDSTSDEWKKDPCCNYHLQDTQCCRKKRVHFKQLLISKFSDEVDTCCHNPDKVKQAMKNMQAQIINIRNTCQAKIDDMNTGIQRISGAITDCFSEMFDASKQKFCVSDSDCDFNCNLFSNKCTPSSLVGGSAAKIFGQCMARKIVGNELAGLKYSLTKKSSASTEEFGNAISDQLTSNFCVSKATPYIRMLDNTLNSNKTKCEEVTKCNDGSNTCANTDPFCGVGCFNDGNSRRCISAIGLTESQCKSFGRCSNGESNISNSTCTSKTFCTHPQFKSATGTDCTGKYICLGYPYLDSKCMFEATVGTSGRKTTCPSGSFYDTRLQKCVGIFISTQAACNLASGTWTAPPTTENECLSYAYCSRFGMTVHMNKTVCESCAGGKWKTSFKPVQASVRNGEFIPYFDWIAARESYTANKYVAGLNNGKVTQFTFKAITSIALTRLGGAFKCMIDPIVSALKLVACDCGNTPRDECFAPTKTVVGQESCFVGVESTFEDSATGGSMQLKSDSCGSSEDGASIQVSVSNLIQKPPKSKDSRATVEAVVAVDSKGNTVCSLVGDGMTISPAPSGGAELCIARDADFSVAATTHTKASFVSRVTGKSNSYRYVDIAVSNDNTEGEFCGTVKDSKEYYPALCTTDVKEEDEKDFGSAGVLSLSMMSLMIVGLISFFM